MPDTAVLRVQPGARVATPLCRLAQELAGLTGWRRFGMALLLGVLLAATLPPFDLTPLIFVAFPGFLWLENGSTGLWASFRLGYVFALGFLVAGLYWIAAALLVDVATFWWLLPFAAVGLPALFAFYHAAGVALTRLAVTRLGLAPTGRVCIFAVAWSGAEWTRGHAMTGFPWNLIGYTWSGGFPGAIAELQSVAWIGIYGLGFLTVLAASLPSLLGIASTTPISRVRRFAPPIAACLLLGVPAIAGAVRLSMLPVVSTGIWLRLVQPSVAESLKWDPTRLDGNLHRMIELSAAPAEHPLTAVLWPEAAVPFLLQRDPAHRNAIAAVAPPNGYVITGALRGDAPPAPARHIWNSIEAIDPAGTIVAHYEKAHLVPFGEYVPFRDILPLKKVTAGSIDLSAGPGPRTLALPGLPPFAPLVCYEVIFPGDVIDPDRRPAWLLNATNDAWYGRSSGPYQHFAISRTRAVEEGLPLIRVANNGISGVVDPEGRVLARVNLDAVGYADVTLPAAQPATFYARMGNGVFAVLLIFGLLGGVARRR